ncbi:MAG: hypothetical protein HFE84_11195 [Lachnospiraceae bacterium]|nr:hypothetical protein [Lachnospiraceae bacterium]
MTFLVVCLFLHIIICLVLFMLMKAGILAGSRMGMGLAWLIPVWGPLCLLVLELRSRGDKEVRGESGTDKLKINDEIYRSILMEEGAPEDRVVPLEEALLVNDTRMRRELMMEIMYGDPRQYVSQLQEARMNDDTEVVHYAVTALTELQKEYDLKFQELDRRMAEKPEKEELLDSCLALLEQYIGIGLLEGNAKSVQMQRYSGLLEKKIRSGRAELSWYLKKIDADLNLGEYDHAYAAIETVLARWPKEEGGYLRLIRYYSHAQNRAGIDHVLNMLHRRNVFLSPEGRSVVRFWGGTSD